jgi:hypothetical protein
MKNQVYRVVKDQPKKMLVSVEEFQPSIQWNSIEIYEIEAKLQRI